MMKTKKMMTAIVAALTMMTGIQGARAESMIEVMDQLAETTPFLNEKGEEVRAIPVMIENDARTAAGTVHTYHGDRPIAVTTLGAALDAAQIVSMSMGVLFVLDGQCEFTGHRCDYNGVLIQATPGLIGGKMSLGYSFVTVAGDDASQARVILPAQALVLKASMLQHWGAPVYGIWDNAPASIDNGTRAVGFEATVTYPYIQFSMGLFRRMTDNSLSNDVMFNGGIGVGM